MQVHFLGFSFFFASASGSFTGVNFKASCYASVFSVCSRILGYSVRAAPLQRGFGGDICPGKSKSLSRCYLGCVARSS